MQLSVVTYEDVHSQIGFEWFRYHMPKDWQGTTLDILGAKGLDANRKLRFALHSKFIDASTLRLLACETVRRLAIGPMPMRYRLEGGERPWDLADDPWSRCAVETAEQYALGHASEGQLRCAHEGALAVISDGFEVDVLPSRRVVRHAEFALAGCAEKTTAGAANAALYHTAMCAVELTILRARVEGTHANKLYWRTYNRVVKAQCQIAADVIRERYQIA